MVAGRGQIFNSWDFMILIFKKEMVGKFCIVIPDNCNESELKRLNLKPNYFGTQSAIMMQTFNKIGGISRAAKIYSAHRHRSLYDPFWKCHRKHIDHVKSEKRPAGYGRLAFERLYCISDEDISRSF
jgi:hypothetical protein